MEEWIKVKEIAKVYNLVKEKYIINNTKEEWNTILKEYNIVYKYELKEITEYSSEISRTKYGGQLTKAYILELYTKKEYLTQIKEIMHDLREMSNNEDEPWELREAVEDEDGEKSKINIFNIVFVLFMIVFIGIQIAICVVHIENEGGIGLAIFMGICIIFELLLTRAVLKKK